MRDQLKQIIAKAMMYGLEWTPSVDDIDVVTNVWAELFERQGHTDVVKIGMAFDEWCSRETEFPKPANIFKLLAPVWDGSDAKPGETWDEYYRRKNREATKRVGNWSGDSRLLDHPDFKKLTRQQ